MNTGSSNCARRGAWYSRAVPGTLARAIPGLNGAESGEMPGLVVLESMWNRAGQLLEDEPSVLPYLKAIKQSLAWEGITVGLVYRRFYSSYDLGLLLEEVRRRRGLGVCYIASHGQRRKLVGIGNRVIRMD